MVPAPGCRIFLYYLAGSRSSATLYRAMAASCSEANPAGALFLHAGALGDCVLTLAIAEALKAARPGMAVDMAARSPVAAWAKANGILRDALSLEQVGGHLLHQADGQLPAQAMQRLHAYEYIISFLGGRDASISRNLVRWFGPAVIPVDPTPNRETASTGRHITHQWTDALNACGFGIRCPLTTSVSISQSMRDTARRRLARAISHSGDRRIVLCHPGSGGLRKCMPIEALERLMAALQNDTNQAAAWMIGPDELERFGAGYAQRLGESGPVVFEESVPQAADLVCGADAYIGFDAGMTHLAAWAGVATVAIFGPTDPQIWRPIGPHCTVVPFPEHESATARWTDHVVTTIRSLLPTTPPQSATGK